MDDTLVRALGVMAGSVLGLRVLTRSLNQKMTSVYSRFAFRFLLAAVIAIALAPTGIFGLIDSSDFGVIGVRGTPQILLVFLLTYGAWPERAPRLSESEGEQSQVPQSRQSTSHAAEDDNGRDLSGLISKKCPKCGATQEVDIPKGVYGREVRCTCGKLMTITRQDQQ